LTGLKFKIIDKYMGYIKANIEKDDGKGGSKSSDNIVKRMTGGSDAGNSSMMSDAKSVNASMQEI
jgi:hypothetical protein